MSKRTPLLPDYDRNAPRKPTNVTINADLLQQARELGLNLSAELEQRLAEVIAVERTKRWLAENAEAISAYNDHVNRDAVFSDGRRRF